MPEELDELKKKIEGGEGPKKGESKQKAEPESVDVKQVERIVERMKKKYVQEGVSLSEVSGKLGELRSIIAEGEQAKINVENVEELQEFKSPMVRQLGRVYMAFRAPFEAVAGIIKTMPLASDIQYYLYSANMRFSLSQWLALALSSAFLVSVFGYLLVGALSITLEIHPLLAVFGPPLAGLGVMGIMVLIPKSRAQGRGEAISVELPFALRHMATELKAGLGLYKTIQTIATADYGVLSEEFARTVAEIEEGTDAKDALRHFAMRTQSKALRSALLHIVRALKTGGNLSEIMTTIAQDVSFDMRVKVRDYAEKMNFFGVIYIFIAIVAPVFLAIIGSILNAPISVGNVSLPPMLLALVYLVAMPFILAVLIMYLKMTQPKV
ncbi:MAG TPA: type II secretion system F family protein [Candidatus Diapherotrites archaeon]|uniref:Type II secretion system F family protein n=1 Tax=Candidatus Iainarchaeum sp. TaxID=3101447 RepID=A0A7J4IXF4_9ARCH|nr:type II secretion system F family protein [Candidatus Diapherotrites archaeon]